MHELASRARSKGKVYFTGGATALLLGAASKPLIWTSNLRRNPSGVFEAIGRLKNELDINVELAAPDDFIAVTDDWPEKSVLIKAIGPLEFYHFDLRAQALSKIERGHQQDLKDASFFVKHGEITGEEFWTYFLAVKPKLIRYPAIDADGLERKVKAFLE